MRGFCRWAILHNKKIRPVTQTINCYGRYLQEFEYYFNQQDSIQFKQQLELYQQDGIPDELAQKMVFISSLNDFPFIVSLSAETAMDFVTVFKLFNEITHYLGLNEIYEKLAKMPSHDYWEQKVSADLQADIKRIIGLLINNILSNKSSTCAEYFDLPSEQQKINRYRRIYQEINTVQPVNLLPYIALARELEKLVA
jgi:glutamate dehydrogenase